MRTHLPKHLRREARKEGRFSNEFTRKVGADEKITLLLYEEKKRVCEILVIPEENDERIC